MVAGHRFLARVTAMVLGGALITGWLGINPPLATAVPRHKTLNDTRSISSGPVAPGHAIDYFGLVADLDAGRDLVPRGRTPYGEARFQVDGRWTDWQRLDQDGAQNDGQFTGSLIAVDHATSYQVRNLPKGAHRWRAAAINTTDGPVDMVLTRGNEAEAAATCRSRADWGANESISAWSKGTDTPSFYPVQIITVHHTAGSNSTTQDYSATMRAIYSFHVKTNGWSDIAYQYLIDSKGVVYEGRNSGHTSKSCLTGGGDGSDFAHHSVTDYLVSGGHVYAQHGGNVGIALMGCYEDGACSGSTAVPSAAVGALTTLLTDLTKRHALNPRGRVHYVNPVSHATMDLPTITGHKDWKATACPGANLYTKLPAIRSEVASRLAPAPKLTGRLYVGSSTSGTAGGVGFADEDVLANDLATSRWSMFFDGSDVGLSAQDVDAFQIRPDGSLLISFTSAFTLTGLGAVDDSDIVRFTPTSTGPVTKGRWSWYFDGSDVGLSTSDEDVDAFSVLADGRLVISTTGPAAVSGAAAADEDLLAFTPTKTGATTAGTWAAYFDGSDVGLSTSSSEDVNGVWVDTAGLIRLSTLGAFSVRGVSGDGSDIFTCKPTRLGSTTACTFSLYWDGSARGFAGEDTDSFSVVR